MARRKAASARSEALLGHLSRHLGVPQTVFTPTDGAAPVVSVAEFAPRPDRRYWTYATLGMSDADQHLPSKPPDWMSPRVELLLYLQERSPWAVEVLNLVARVPFERRSWLYWWHTVDLGGPFDLSAACPLTAALLLPPYFEAEGFDELQVQDRPVRFLMVFPITESERLLAVARGGRRLEELLMEANVPFVFKGPRPPVA